MTRTHEQLLREEIIELRAEVETLKNELSKATAHEVVLEADLDQQDRAVISADRHIDDLRAENARLREALEQTEGLLRRAYDSLSDGAFGGGPIPLAIDAYFAGQEKPPEGSR